MWGEHKDMVIEDTVRLDLSTRNKLQIELMKLMLPDLSEKSEFEWITEYSERVSNIIDHTDNALIRDLALQGKIKESASLLKEKLLAENFRDRNLN